MKNFCFIFFFVFSASTCLEGQVKISCTTDTVWTAGQYNRVEVDVFFDTSNGFARFTQDFPEGLEVVPENIGAGDFSWYNNQLNIVWLNIPESKKITCSYLVMPDKSMTGGFDLEGRLVVITGGKTKRTFRMNIVKISVSGTQPAETVSGIESGRRVRQTESVRALNNQESMLSAPASDKIEFRVQVASYSTPVPAEQVAKRLGLGPGEKLIMVKAGNVYRYQAGSFSAYEDAVALQKRLAGSGLKDAFVVAYNGETQIPVSEAVRQLKARK